MNIFLFILHSAQLRATPEWAVGLASLDVGAWALARGSSGAPRGAGGLAEEFSPLIVLL